MRSDPRGEAPSAGGLGVLVQFRRQSLDDGTWADYGAPHPAKRQDLRADERWRSGTVAATVEVRFTVRHNPFTASMTPRDRLVCDGVEHVIVGRRELGRREHIAFTCARRADLSS